ncbi:MAG: DUF5131 family protein [Thermoleophilia bacterium]
MNRTKIEWVRNPDGSQGFTWNPVTGCLHGCSYCYARRIAKRFRGASLARQVGTARNHLYQSEPRQTFPMGFQPTFYPDRLSEPLARRKPSTIFVCSMADLFGAWVPAEWIEAVLKTVSQAPQHTFIFLTKNPERYREFTFPGNCFLGATVTRDHEWSIALNALFQKKNRVFVSAEPLLESILNCGIEGLDWLIIGRETGPSNDKVMPRREWVIELCKAAIDADVPVFTKNNLHDNPLINIAVPYPFIQQFPEVRHV